MFPRIFIEIRGGLGNPPLRAPTHPPLPRLNGRAVKNRTAAPLLSRKAITSLLLGWRLSASGSSWDSAFSYIPNTGSGPQFDPSAPSIGATVQFFAARRPLKNAGRRNCEQPRRYYRGARNEATSAPGKSDFKVKIDPRTLASGPPTHTHRPPPPDGSRCRN